MGLSKGNALYLYARVDILTSMNLHTEDQEAGEQEIPQEENVIPAQYRGLPREVVEQIWQPPQYIDPEINRQEQERRDKALEQISQQEAQDISTETQDLESQMAELPPERLALVSQAQQESAQLISDHFNGVSRLDEKLTPHEAVVLGKAEDLYKKAKAERPNEPVAFQFTEKDNAVYSNLIRKLALEKVRDKAGEKDKEKLADLQKELGIEKSHSNPEQINKNEMAQPDYEGIAENIPLDEAKPPLPESFIAPAGGNMFEDADTPTLAGKIIANVMYDHLVERPQAPKVDAMKVIEQGKIALNAFIENVNKRNKQPFAVTKPAGVSGFHLNGEEGRVSRDHLFYFSKSSSERKSNDVEEVRAYITLNPKDVENIQGNFVDLCQELYDAGIDFMLGLILVQKLQAQKGWNNERIILCFILRNLIKKRQLR
jgi:hypothetical protein